MHEAEQAGWALAAENGLGESILCGLGESILNGHMLTAVDYIGISAYCYTAQHFCSLVFRTDIAGQCLIHQSHEWLL